MAEAEKNKSKFNKFNNVPGLTPDSRENQLVALAVDLVEQRLRDGTATSQETTHFLKLATKKAQLELDILERERELISAKTEALKSSSKDEAFYKEVVEAIKLYGGHVHGHDGEVYDNGVGEQISI